MEMHKIEAHFKQTALLPLLLNGRQREPPVRNDRPFEFEGLLYQIKPATRLHVHAKRHLINEQSANKVTTKVFWAAIGGQAGDYIIAAIEQPEKFHVGRETNC